MPKFLDLQLVSYKLEEVPDVGLKVAAGELRNLAAAVAYADIKIEFRFFDKDGKDLGTGTDEVKTLAGNATWAFKVLAPDGAVRAEVTDITGAKP